MWIIKHGRLIRETVSETGTLAHRELRNGCSGCRGVLVDVSLARVLHGGHRSGSWQCCVTEEAYRNDSRQATELLVVRHEMSA
jgi:hypothetical protein